jgi:hypothetical protein
MGIIVAAGVLSVVAIVPTLAGLFVTGPGRARFG